MLQKINVDMSGARSQVDISIFDSFHSVPILMGDHEKAFGDPFIVNINERDFILLLLFFFIG